MEILYSSILCGLSRNNILILNKYASSVERGPYSREKVICENKFQGGGFFEDGLFGSVGLFEGEELVRGFTLYPPVVYIFFLEDHALRIHVIIMALKKDLIPNTDKSMLQL